MEGERENADGREGRWEGEKWTLQIVAEGLA